MDKKKADQQASPKHSGIENTTTQAQRARLLDALLDGPITTIEARSRLNIMMPAARVKELRALGHPIVTHLRNLYDDQGRRHSRVAVYYLSVGSEVAA
ncbi:helix-turn-helix domain-containing protein [Pseudomonas sp. MOIL14HWK12:I2]|uniref:helix-turn-helix domain-containing protein n=1 Tax=Pseudomonas sp. MOIL14HWK12:I2 TaxID=1033994 RepID=UPI00040F2B6F|nr:helix-turn-helix domain-containing protein [Pseudomonas sp. MOIL14HWK12:I2]